MKVPTWEQQVDSRALPPVYERAYSTGAEAIGQGLQQAGQGMAQVSATISRQREHEAQESRRTAQLADHTAVLLAMDQLETTGQLLRQDFDKLSGEDVFGGGRKVYAELAKAREQISKERLKNQAQRDLFQVESGKYDRLIRDHVERQTVKAGQAVQEGAELVSMQRAEDLARNSAMVEGGQGVLHPIALELAEDQARRVARQTSARLGEGGQAAGARQREAWARVQISAIQGLANLGQYDAARARLQELRPRLGGYYEKIEKDLMREEDQGQQRQVAGALNVLLQQWMNTHRRASFSPEALAVIADQANPYAADARDRLERKIQGDLDDWKRAQTGLPEGPDRTKAWLRFQTILANPDTAGQITGQSPDEFYNTWFPVLSSKHFAKAMEDREAALKAGGKTEIPQQVLLREGRESGRYPKVSKGKLSINDPSTWSPEEQARWEQDLEQFRVWWDGYKTQHGGQPPPKSEYMQNGLPPVFRKGTILGGKWMGLRDVEATQGEARAQGKSATWIPADATAEDIDKARKAVEATGYPVTDFNVAQNIKAVRKDPSDPPQPFRGVPTKKKAPPAAPPAASPPRASPPPAPEEPFDLITWASKKAAAAKAGSDEAARKNAGRSVSDYAREEDEKTRQFWKSLGFGRGQ